MLSLIGYSYHNRHPPCSSAMMIATRITTPIMDFRLFQPLVRFAFARSTPQVAAPSRTAPHDE